jgi:predicted RNA-binding Zn-ribbon protein involved in translation (DUF1610 family)
MATTIFEKCPLCSSDAVFYFVDYEERKYFKCPSCSTFQITRRAEDRLRGAPTQWKEQLAARAQNTPAEHLLVISVPPATVEEGRSTEALSAEYLPKSQLPL